MLPGMTSFGLSDSSLASRGKGSYANPHATIAIKDIPVHIRQIFRLTRFYYAQDSLLGALVDKMSEYPITDVIVKAKSSVAWTDKHADKWKRLLNVSLNVRAVMLRVNIDKYVFGNSFHYIYYPFVRYCTCTTCGSRVPIQRLMNITGNLRQKDERDGFELIITAPCESKTCGGASRQHRTTDVKSEARSGLTMVRLNPLLMFLEFNPSSNQRIWYWHPPQIFKDGLASNSRAILETTELKILEAAQLGRKLELNRDRLWVAQSEGIPGLWEGWGVPPLFRVLEDVYYYKLLRRANEALAQEHVTPLRILTPGSTGDVSPQRSLNLSDWQKKLQAELKKFKQDPNHIVVSPMPINVEQMGGQARVLMVAAELEEAARRVGMGVGCPLELVMGGLNWSGASVSLRVLENHFINDRENCEQLLHFLEPKLATYFRLPRAELSLADFKMADDVQQQASSINLMLQGFISRASVLSELKYDPEKEFNALEKEHARMNTITMKDNVAAAHMNTVIQALEAKAQALLQFEMELMQGKLQAQKERMRLGDLQAHVQRLHELGYTAPAEFDQSSALLARLAPEVQQLIVTQWGATMPMVTQLLMARIQQDQSASMAAQSAMQSASGAQSAGAAEGAAMAPGAQGPYSDGPSALPGGPAASNPGSAGRQPSQLPPRGQNSGI